MIQQIHVAVQVKQQRPFFVHLLCLMLDQYETQLNKHLKMFLSFEHKTSPVVICSFQEACGVQSYQLSLYYRILKLWNYSMLSLTFFSFSLT